VPRVSATSPSAGSRPASEAATRRPPGKAILMSSSRSNFFSSDDDSRTPMDAARGPSATAVNSDDAAYGALDELCGMIRKRDKRIGGFGHEQVLQNNGAWPGYGNWPDGRGESIGA
jgi:hypothetical protein